MFEKYNFGTDFQDLLLACIIQKPEKFMHNVGTLNSAYFFGVERIAAARALFAYWRKNHKFPAKNALCQIVYDSIVRSSDAKEEDNINKYVEKLRDMDTSDADYVVERVVAFARERALYIAIEKSHEFLVAGETPPGGFGKMFEDALKIGAMGDPFYSLGELATGIIDDNQTLLGNRFLCRGGGLLQISYTGVGKSTVGIQQDMLWALGKPAIGIKPARPLRILCIQAENDRDDQIEAASGIAAGLRLSQADLDQISESTRYIYHSAKTGGEFIDTVLQPALSRFPCDLVRLDPLIAYVGGDISKPDVVAAFLRNGLNPVLARHQAGCIINHHTPKPTAETTKFKRKLSEWVYAAAGSYDLMGWARAALVFTPTSEPSVFRFIAAKRGQRIGWEVGGSGCSSDILHTRRKGFAGKRRPKSRSQRLPQVPKGTGEEQRKNIPLPGFCPSWRILAPCATRTFFKQPRHRVGRNPLSTANSTRCEMMAELSRGMVSGWLPPRQVLRVKEIEEVVIVLSLNALANRQMIPSSAFTPMPPHTPLGGCGWGWGLDEISANDLTSTTLRARARLRATRKPIRHPSCCPSCPLFYPS